MQKYWRSMLPQGGNEQGGIATMPEDREIFWVHGNIFGPSGITIVGLREQGFVSRSRFTEHSKFSKPENRDTHTFLFHKESSFNLFQG